MVYEEVAATSYTIKRRARGCGRAWACLLTLLNFIHFFNRPTTIILDRFDLMAREARIDGTLGRPRELARQSPETQIVQGSAIINVVGARDTAQGFHNGIPNNRLGQSVDRLRHKTS